MKKIKILLSFFVLLSFLSCGNDDDENSTPSGEPNGEDTTLAFTVQKLLRQTADNYIIPAYGTAASEALALKEAAVTFTNNPNSENLADARAAYRKAFKAWQGVVIFDFGTPATDESFKTIGEDLNTFPVDEEEVERFITAGTTEINLFQLDTKGYSTVGYLLFKGTEEEVIASFDENRKVYFQAVVNDIESRVLNARTIWKDTYRDEFVTDGNTSAGSSVSLLYNQFLIGYENIKNFKLSIPAGMAVGQENPDAKKLEAYHDADLSKQLINANFKAIENVWFGQSFDGTDGIGFEEWLAFIEESDAISKTITAFEAIKDKIEAIEETSLEEAINGDLKSVEAVVTEFQKSTRYIKSELSPLIRVAITFNSGDGD